MTFDLKFWGTRGGYPTAEQTISLQLKAAGRSILIDAAAQRLFGYPQELLAIDTVLMTHLHLDHAALLPHLVLGRMKRLKADYQPQACPIYAPEPIAALMIQLEMTPELYTFSTQPPQCIGDIRLSYCPTQHTRPNYAYRFELQGKTLVVSGDTRYFPEFVDFCRGADLLVCECTDGDENAEHAARFLHMTCGDVARLAREAGVGQLALYHFTDLDAPQAQQAVEDWLGGSISVTAARDELEITL